MTAIRKQLGDTYEVDTVHKFQGREQDAIILTSVDNVITDFVDDPHMLNVAVSRAVHSLAVVTSQDPRNDQTNYGDLTRYIEYNNFELIQSQPDILWWRSLLSPVAQYRRSEKEI